MNKRKSLNYSRYGYIFSIPFIVAFLIFNLYPIGYTLILGFTDLKGAGNTEINFLTETPFKNFKDILNNAIFKKSLLNTVTIWIKSFIPQIGLALLLTAWFTDNRIKLKTKGFFKIVFYFPNIITAATVAILFSQLFGHPYGVVNDVLKSLGFLDDSYYFFNSTKITPNVVSFIQFWMWFGYSMITFISGVIGIDPAIFEAAEIDGANRVQTFFRITIPCIRQIMLFSLVTSLIGGLNMFDIPKLLNNGGPDNSTLTAAVFIQTQAFAGSFLYARAAAASMIMFVIIAICSSALFFILRDRDASRLEKLRKAELRAAKKAI